MGCFPSYMRLLCRSPHIWPNLPICLDFENTLLNGQKGNIEGSFTNIKDKNVFLIYLLVKTIVNGCNSWLVDDMQHIETRNGPGDAVNCSRKQELWSHHWQNLLCLEWLLPFLVHNLKIRVPPGQWTTAKGQCFMSDWTTTWWHLLPPVTLLHYAIRH